ncbi:ATP-binding protein [Herbaspirillum rhizosphaerae]|uniref:histidine kinase n=1 Tax=Herbaspirillum rhizosphaerae TaxID=346179 RepID=A0ABW8ZA25_9BURK
MSEVMARFAGAIRQIRTQHFILLSGILLSVSVLSASIYLENWERQRVDANRVGHGADTVRTLSSHAFAVLSALNDSAALFAASNLSENSAIATSSESKGTLLQWKSLSLLDQDQRVLRSSEPLARGTYINLKKLGFVKPPTEILAPGKPLRVGGAYMIPFVRQIQVGRARILMLAMLDPTVLFFGLDKAPSLSYTALLDGDGDVIGASDDNDRLIGQHYSVGVMLTQLLRDTSHPHDHHGRFAMESPMASDSTQISYQFLPKFPIIAIAAEAGSPDSNVSPLIRLSWAGGAIAVAMLILSLFLWRFMRQRADVESELHSAKDAADKANSSRGEFLSTMSHEIRTPMNAIIGMASLIRTTHLDAQQDSFAKGIEDSAQALMNIIDDILDFSKIDAGKLKIEALELDLLAIVEASVDVLATRANEKGLRLSSYVDPRVPALLRGDPGRLRQVLLNLLGNAIKFTSAGEIAVQVQLVGEVPGHCRIHVQVSDTGIGINKQTQEKLFMPFSQADGSVTRKYGGTGLGLSICKRLIGLMEGEIGVESEYGSGSTFWFELSLPIIQSGSSPEYMAGELLLIAPDDDAIRALRRYAEARGVTVHRALTLEQGRQLMRRLASNVIAVVDTVIPDFSLPAFAQIRREWHAVNTWLLLAQDEDMREDLRAQVSTPVLSLPIKRSVFYHALSGNAASLGHDSAMVQVSTGSVDAVLDKADGDVLILLVEDNPMNQKVAIHQLQLLGYETDVAADGQEALVMLERNRYAAVLMDCQMPGMDGFEATRRIRAREKTGGKHIPIIAMTANAMTGDRERCLEAGMDDYLSKPILRNRLDDTLSKYVCRNASDTMSSSSTLNTAPGGPQEILDMARLLELFDDDRGAMQAMLSFFITNTRPILMELKAAAARDDFGAAIDLLHRLIGSCSNLGAAQMTVLANEGDAAARLKDGDRLRQLGNALIQAFQILEQRTNEMKETI